MEVVVTFLRDWKELVGAVIGGVFALLVALLVAYQARRSEERTAATLLIGKFLRISAMVENAKAPAGLTAEEQSHVLAEHLCRFRVRLSPLFDASIARVLHIDVYLAGTMTIASSFIRDTEPVIERLSQDVEALHRGEKPKRNDTAITSDINVVAGGYRLIEQHAKHSARLLQEIALSRCATCRKLRRHLAPSADDRELAALLESGGAPTE